MKRALALLPLLVAAGACELREIAIAEAEDTIVAEIVLIAGQRRQVAVLHRTFGDHQASQEVGNARIEVSSASGETMPFAEAAPPLCFEPDPDVVAGSCYRSVADHADFVRPGEEYTLRIELPDGRLLTGTTVVPEAFAIVQPAAPLQPCALPPDTTLELMWTRATGAWAYTIETRLTGLAAALRQRGVELETEPLRLVGLAVGVADTAIIFPTELGLFDRFDSDLADALLAIRGGLPPRVLAHIIIAAADRNYVNWLRGGRFNPSGMIRVPSVHGDGTGVFGSVSTQGQIITTSPARDEQPC